MSSTSEPSSQHPLDCRDDCLGTLRPTFLQPPDRPVDAAQHGGRQMPSQIRRRWPVGLAQPSQCRPHVVVVSATAVVQVRGVGGEVDRRRALGEGVDIDDPSSIAVDQQLADIEVAMHRYNDGSVGHGRGQLVDQHPNALQEPGDGKRRQRRRSIRSSQKFGWAKIVEAHQSRVVQFLQDCGSAASTANCVVSMQGSSAERLLHHCTVVGPRLDKSGRRQRAFESVQRPLSPGPLNRIAVELDDNGSASQYCSPLRDPGQASHQRVAWLDTQGVGQLPAVSSQQRQERVVWVGPHPPAVTVRSGVRLDDWRSVNRRTCVVLNSQRNSRCVIDVTDPDAADPSGEQLAEVRRHRFGVEQGCNGRELIVVWGQRQ